jgi:hypothetical protein
MRLLVSSVVGTTDLIMVQAYLRLILRVVNDSYVTNRSSEQEPSQAVAAEAMVASLRLVYELSVPCIQLSRTYL